MIHRNLQTRMNHSLVPYVTRKASTIWSVDAPNLYAAAIGTQPNTTAHLTLPDTQMIKIANASLKSNNKKYLLFNNIGLFYYNVIK